MSGFTAEFVNGNTRHFLLTCTTQDLPRDTNVIAVKIYNFTTSHILAWVAANDGHPKFGNGSVGWNRFVSGRLASGDGSHAWLQLLHLDHDDSHTAYFGCNISVMRDQAHIVDIVLKTNSAAATQRMDSIAPTTSTKATTPAHDTETQIRTGNVLQPPTVLETGVPMTVLIVLIVLITVLVVITMALLLQKFRGRCAAHELHHYPPPNMGHYSLAGNTPLDNSWEEKMTSKGSHPSLHCMPRSHYSLPRPPPPPLPKLTRSRSRNYASNGRIPGTVRSHYMTPYDAIAQDSSEDGDLSLLNTSRHDLTPSLPPEVAGETTYNVPRGDLQGQVLAQAQTPSPVQTQLPVLGQGQVHTFYPCTTLKTPHPLPLE
ncbi:hypothetical protein C0Q70_12002 [Pomacea canaliculata]|uniref:Uncharacterized protein n=1 Tax=Pomacea canaliculata TaxID=400727 RepID=A0A2T7P0A8_POMCA|nr:hypothetical protein C0Q70_12002 [Pomacea canaliculata]